MRYMGIMCGSGYLSASFKCCFIMDANFVVKYSYVLRENTVPCHHNGQCILWTSCRDKSGYGRINLKINGQWKNWRTHRLSFLLYHNLQPTDLLNKDVSHLCHNESCIEPAHLSLESREINNERKGCVHANFCQHHASFPDCMLTLKF